MRGSPLSAEKIISHVSERYKESIFRKENVVITFDSNIDGIVFLTFTNTGKRPVHLRKITISKDWIESVNKVIPDFEREGRLEKTLKDIEEYDETIFPLQSVSFQLFHFFYSFKPWFIPIESNSTIELKKMAIDEIDKLNGRQKYLSEFYKKRLIVSFKISRHSIFKKNVYLRFGKRFDITFYQEELENDLFDERGRRLNRERTLKI